MTHSLHRSGSPENLSGDFVVLTMAGKGINETDCQKALGRFLEIADKCSSVVLGDMRQGCSPDKSLADLLAGLSHTSIVHTLFKDQDTLKAFLQELAREDLGLSVTVSGLLEPLEQLSREIGLPDSPHTVAYSLGVRGKLELLPDMRIREITTMCGHGLVSPALVSNVIDELVIGASSPENAAQKLAGPCLCGIFNPCRAASLLEAILAQRSVTATEADGCPVPDPVQGCFSAGS